MDEKVLGRLAHTLYVQTEEIGFGLLVARSAFILLEDPPAVRGPDISWLSPTRASWADHSGRYRGLAPGFAVEVRTDSNWSSAIEQRIKLYFLSGTRLIWIVDPRERCVTVFEVGQTARLHNGREVIGGGALLPDLRVDLSAIFARAITADPGNAGGSPGTPA
jgi:Uma2 family endonuclease